jgi:hypothetical protein
MNDAGDMFSGIVLYQGHINCVRYMVYGIILYQEPC